MRLGGLIFPALGASTAVHIGYLLIPGDQQAAVTLASAEKVGTQYSIKDLLLEPDPLRISVQDTTFVRAHLLIVPDGEGNISLTGGGRVDDGPEVSVTYAGTARIEEWERQLKDIENEETFLRTMFSLATAEADQPTTPS